MSTKISKKEITLSRIINYLEEKENCKVISINNNISIFDLKKQQLKLYNKDYRLLNDIAKDYVKKKYPLFHKDLFHSTEDVILNIFKIPIDVQKFKKVKPFKKIVKKSVITKVNDKGQVLVRKIIRKRNLNSSNI